MVYIFFINKIDIDYFINSINSMSYLDKLPGELLKAVYSFIYPAFEYECYLNALKNHNEERLCFSNMVHNATDDSDMDIESRIHNNDLITTYSLLMNDSLAKIYEFVEKNPKLKRPYNKNQLKPWEFRTAWQTYYSELQFTYVEKQIKLNNYISGNGRCNNIVYMLYNGTLWELIHECIKNGIYAHIDHHNNDDSQTRKILVKMLMKL